MDSGDEGSRSQGGQTAVHVRDQICSCGRDAGWARESCPQQGMEEPGSWWPGVRWGLRAERTRSLEGDLGRPGSGARHFEATPGGTKDQGTWLKMREAARHTRRAQLWDLFGHFTWYCCYFVSVSMASAFFGQILKNSTCQEIERKKSRLSNAADQSAKLHED